jgi:6-phosphofructokinase 1
VAIKNNEVVDYNINEALCMKKSIDLELCEICKAIAK